MGGDRTSVVTSLVLFVACGGKLTDVGGNPSTGTPGSTGTTTGDMQTTTGTGDPGPGGPFGSGGVDTGAGGSNTVSTPCGSVVCGPGLVCCNASCGVCVLPNQACDAIACATPFDASVGGQGGSVPPPGGGDVAGRKSNFGFMLKDSWFITGCAQKAGHDCITVQACPNGNAADFEDRGAVVNEIFPLGGETGKMYAVSFKFNGISEAKFYQGGSWARSDIDTATPGGPPPIVNEGGVANDTFYIGGTAVASNYNVPRIRVLDPTKKEIGRYYMNAFPPPSGAESHRTFLLSYAHTIDVLGGGFVEFHIADSNCHAIDNCGPGNVSDTVCDAARNIPNENNAVLPAMYTDVSKQAPTPVGSPVPVMVSLASLNPITGAKQPWHAQISHLTVTKVVAK